MRSCCKIEYPINNGYDALPSNKESHKFKIFWIGNTSEKNVDELIKCNNFSIML